MSDSVGDAPPPWTVEFSLNNVKVETGKTKLAKTVVTFDPAGYLRCEGIDGEALVPDFPTLNGMRDDLTLAAWVQIDPAAGNGVRRIFGNDGGWTCGIFNGGLRFTTRTILSRSSGSWSGAGPSCVM